MKGNLKKVHPSVLVDKIIIPDSEWFNVDHAQVGHYLKDIFENYKSYKEKANRQAFKNNNEFSWEKMATKINDLLSTSIPEIPQEIELQLPKLNLPKLQKING